MTAGLRGQVKAPNKYGASIKGGRIMKKIEVLTVLGITLASLILTAGTVQAQQGQNGQGQNGAIVIDQIGSLSAGAQVLKDPGADGAEFHYDYLYSSFVIPKGARQNSLILWHGCLGAAWERRQDGGPGFQSLLVQRRFPVFVIDQPRISRGARGLGAYSFNAVTTGASAATPRGPCNWNTFRYGAWFPPAPRTFFPGVQLAQDPASVAALCELSGSPGGPTIASTDEGRVVVVNAVSALLDKKAGNSVLVTHSANGRYGWLERIKNDKVKGIVAYEPVHFVFPSDAPPAPIPGCCQDPTNAGFVAPILVSPQEFQKLTQIPIQIVFGDNLDKVTDPASTEEWRVIPQRAQQFVDVVNSRGGDAQLLFMPKIGVFGNTHFLFADLNNEKIADLLVDFLKSKGLEK
jgi:hypothetical protein